MNRDTSKTIWRSLNQEQKDKAKALIITRIIFGLGNERDSYETLGTIAMALAEDLLHQYFSGSPERTLLLWLDKRNAGGFCIHQVTNWEGGQHP